jgi:uncharacterized protein YpuA (DUF1002 family)
VRYLKVRDNPDLVRDIKSGAILNVNEKMILKAREKKMKEKKRQEEFEQMKSDLQEIKDLLQNFLSKIGG